MISAHFLFLTLIFYVIMHVCQKKQVPLQYIKSGCSAVGSALRSGRRGRKFESCHPDKQGVKILDIQYFSPLFCFQTLAESDKKP